MTLRRKGYALVELLLVISIVTIMLALCAGMIHLLLKLDRAGRSATEVANDLARLSRDFRGDAHASSPVEPGAISAEKITFATSKSKTVEYLVRPGDILRTVREGDKIRHYELYRRPLHASVRIEIKPESRPPFVAIIIDRPADGVDDSLYRDYRIEAELAKDRRLNARAE